MYEQEDMGRDLNLRVPKNLRKSFSRKVRYTTRKHFYGVVKAQNYINPFFRKMKLPLKCRFFYYDEINDHEHFIVENIRAGKDTIVCFNWKGLGKNKNFGHCCLITGIKLGKYPRLY